MKFYLNNIFKSEFSANVIDLCPVGALTSKPFAFKARSWELKKKETVDILDGLGSNIIVQTCNNNIVRILPKNNKNINLEWISDKTRFFFDSIKYQRIDKPLFKENNSFKEISWEEAFIKINNEVIKTDPNNCQAKVGNLIDLKSLYSFKKLMSTLGINNIQYDSLKKLLQLLVSAYPEISINRIVGHSDIAPERKTDPGPFFDWSILNDII